MGRGVAVRQGEEQHVEMVAVFIRARMAPCAESTSLTRRSVTVHTKAQKRRGKTNKGQRKEREREGGRMRRLSHTHTRAHVKMCGRAGARGRRGENGVHQPK